MRLLLLPGLGDVHWVLMKLQSWLEKKGHDWRKDPPELHIWDIDNRPRTMEYFKYVPWVRAGGYWRLPLAEEHARFHSLYMKENSLGDCIPNFHGFDYFIATNGNMRSGVAFPEIMSGAEVNFEYGPLLPPNTFGEEFGVKGPFFVLCFSGFGMFEKAWCRVMTPDVIKSMIRALRRRFPEHRFVFTGCSWDDAFARHCVSGDDEFIVGQTSLPQLFSLLQSSDGFLGWCGGNSILAQHLGIPTVVWWSSKYFPRHDRKGWQTPHAYNSHLVLNVENYREKNTVPSIGDFLEAANAGRAALVR